MSLLRYAPADPLDREQVATAVELNRLDIEIQRLRKALQEIAEEYPKQGAGHMARKALGVVPGWDSGR